MSNKNLQNSLVNQYYDKLLNNYKTKIQKMFEEIKSMVAFPNQIKTQLAKAFDKFSELSHQKQIILNLLDEQYGIELSDSDKSDFLASTTKDLKQLFSLADDRANEIADYASTAYNDVIAKELQNTVEVTEGKIGD